MTEYATRPAQLRSDATATAEKVLRRGGHPTQYFEAQDAAGNVAVITDAAEVADQVLGHVDVVLTERITVTREARAHRGVAEQRAAERLAIECVTRGVIPVGLPVFRYRYRHLDSGIWQDVPEWAVRSGHMYDEVVLEAAVGVRYLSARQQELASEATLKLLGNG